MEAPRTVETICAKPAVSDRKQVTPEVARRALTGGTVVAIVTPQQHSRFTATEGNARFAHTSLYAGIVHPNMPLFRLDVSGIPS